MAGTNLFAPLSSSTTGAMNAFNDEYGYAFFAKGVTVPTDTAAGYARGCLWFDTDAAATAVLYVNEGSETSCKFNVINPAATTATAYDDIGDPDANGSIAMGAFTGTYTSATTTWAGMIMENSAGNPAGGANLLSLKYTADGDANGIFLSCIDNAGADTKFQIAADGATTIAGNATGTAALTITAGDITVTAGDVDIKSNTGKVSIGANGDADCYVSYSTTNGLTFYDDILGVAKTLSELAGGGLTNPVVTGDLTITDGKFTWTDAVAEAAGVWTFAGTTTTDIAISSAVTTGGVLTITANSLTSGTGVKVVSTAAGFTTGNYFEATEDAATVFEVGAGGITTIAGTAGSDSFILTAGDAKLSDGSVTITDADVASSLVITNNAVATADLVSIASTGCTTGAMMKINANAITHDGEVLELISAGDATATPVGMSVTIADVVTGAARGIEVTMVGATTTAKGIAVTMDALTEGSMLYLDNGGATLTTGYFINCNDDTAVKFGVGLNGNTTIAGTAAGTAAMTLSLGDLVITDTDLTTITSVNGTGNIVEFISGGAIGAGKGVVVIDAAGTLNATGCLLRLEADGVTATNNPYAQIIDATGIDMGAMNIDSDSATLSAIKINSGGNIANTKGIVELINDGNIASGGSMITAVMGGTPNAAAIGLNLNVSKDAKAAVITSNAATNDAVLITHATGALASGKAVLHVTSSGDPAAAAGYVGHFAYTGTGTQPSAVLFADATGKNVVGLRVDTDNTVASNSGSVLLYSDVATAQGPSLVSHADSASPAADDEVFGIHAYGEEATSGDTIKYARQTFEILVSTDTITEGAIKMAVDDGGSMRESFFLTDDTLNLGDSAAFTLGSTGAYDLSISTKVTAAGLTALEPKIVFTDGAAGNITVTAGGTSGLISLVSPTLMPSTETITAGTGGALSLATTISLLETDGPGDAYTLAAGTAGQIKAISFITDGGGDAVVTLTGNNAAYDVLTFSDIGESVLLMYTASGWQILSAQGVVIS